MNIVLHSPAHSSSDTESECFVWTVLAASALTWSVPVVWLCLMRRGTRVTTAKQSVESTATVRHAAATSTD